jgi:archaeal type IV pilus assembly protein PilA
MNFSLKQKKRSAVSPVIATLLLIAIAVAAAIIVYAFVTGLIGGLSGSSGSSLVTLTGTISVPSGTGAGVFVLTAKNGANTPINSIIVTLPTTPPLSSGTAQVVTPVLAYGASAGTISASNPLPIGATASGAALITNGVAGQGYTVVITITFANGSIQVQTLDITGQI